MAKDKECQDGVALIPSFWTYVGVTSYAKYPGWEGLEICAGKQVTKWRGGFRQTKVSSAPTQRND